MPVERRERLARARAGYEAQHSWGFAFIFLSWFTVIPLGAAIPFLIAGAIGATYEIHGLLGSFGAIVWFGTAIVISRKLYLRMRRNCIAAARGYFRCAPLCPKCGYDLTGISVAVCPECGEPIPRKRTA